MNRVKKMLEGEIESLEMPSNVDTEEISLILNTDLGIQHDFSKCKENAELYIFNQNKLVQLNFFSYLLRQLSLCFAHLFPSFSKQNSQF